MKLIGKIVIAAAVVAALAGGTAWFVKQRAASDPETRYKLGAVEKGDVT